VNVVKNAILDVLVAQWQHSFSLFLKPFISPVPSGSLGTGIEQQFFIKHMKTGFDHKRLATINSHVEVWGGLCGSMEARKVILSTEISTVTKTV
jgi:hypothetical protein